MILLLLACNHKPPQVLPEPQEWAPVPTVEIVPRDHECEITDLYYGDQVVLEGCDGHIIPVSKALELTYSEDLVDYWKPRALHCEAWRASDRRACQATYDAKWTEAEHLRRRGVWLELGVVGAFLAGAIFGGAVAVAIETATPPPR